MPRSAKIHEESEETRRAILRAAEQLFMDFGYRSVSTRQVAEASGVKQPALYYYFPDKEALFIEMLREHAATTRAALERIVARQNTSLPERLRQIIRYLRTSRQPNMGVFLHEMRHDIRPEGQREMAELFRSSIVAPIMALFTEGVASGFVRDPAESGVSPREATFLVLSATSMAASPPVHGHNAPWQGAEPTFGPEGAPEDTIVRALLFGIAAQPKDTSASD